MRPKIAITEEFLKMSVGTRPLKGHQGCYVQQKVEKPDHEYLKGALCSKVFV